ncbi:MAG: hypothetical protein N4A63_05195 [Vallitalea sp.]|nr:hypothetical protein [Vallitalea sp.]
MKDIYLVNYCSTGCIPLKSISRLPEEDAFKLAKELWIRNRGTSFNRFSDDFKYYYPKRIRTEEWLYNCFVSLGGKPMTKHPLYFVLDGSDYLNRWFNRGHVTRLSLNNINSKDISFTLGDSMSRMDKSEREDPFMKDTLFKMIQKYNNNIELFLKKTCKGFNYIEVQLWNDKYIENI